MMPLLRSGRLSLLSLLFGLGACSGDEAQFGPERSVPQQQRPVVLGRNHQERFGLSDMRGTARSERPAGFSAATPPGWEIAPATDMRQLNWRIPGGGECYLTAGVGGGLLANVNRWVADQFGQAPLGKADFDALPRFPLLGKEAALVMAEGDFKGMGGAARQGYKLLGLVGGSDADMVTLKFTGPRELVDQNREAFLAVARSIRAGAASDQPPPEAQPRAPDPHAQAAPVPPSGAAPFEAEIPSGWQPLGDTASRFLRHRFGQQGECYVGQLGGALSGMFGIWYGEVGQEPPGAAAIAALPQIELLGEKAHLLELTGEFRGMGGPAIADARLLVAVRSEGNGVVFAKCIGSTDEVAANKQAFLAFCKSLRRSGS